MEEGIMSWVIMDVAATTDAVPFMVSAGPNSQWRQASGSVPLYGPWHITAVREVFRVAGVAPDWDTYGSLPPSSRATDVALELLRYVVASELEYLIPTPYVFPVSGGGVRLEWEDNQKELAFEVLPDGSVEFFRAREGQPADEGALAPDRIPGLLEWLAAA